MRGLLLIVGLALAGCDDAVVLEVHPAPNAPTDTVQLFIGLYECGDCPGIQPPDGPAVLPGNVFYREDSYRETVVRTARVENGVARFRIESSEVGGAFALAVAVDAAGKSAAVVRSLPLDKAARYRVDLIPANASGRSGLGPKPDTTDGSFVGIWQQPNGTLPCMGFEQWSQGHLDGRIFIVPADDLDCDARLNDVECAPYGYDATGVPTFEEATCLTATPITVDTSICSLGGPACDEVSGQDLPCAATDYCVPSTFCDPVNQLPCAGSPDLAACLFSPQVTTSANLKCTIAIQPASDNTHSVACSSNFEFDLFPASVPAAASLACAGPNESLLLPAPIVGTPLAFQDFVTIVMKDANGKTFPVNFKLRWSFDGCRYRVDHTGDLPLDPIGTDGRRVFAQLWVSRSGGAMRKLLVPVELSFTDSCERESTCALTFDGADSIGACLR